MAEQRLRAVILDLDGTLCCTVGDLKNAMNAMLTEFGFPLQDDRSILEHINEGGYEFVKKSLPADCREDDTMCRRAFESYCRYYDAHSCDSTYIYTGVAESLDALKKQGIRLACFTNKPDGQAQEVISRLFREGLFDIVLGAGKFPMKPEPEGILWILSQFGVSPGEAVYIGDSDVDMHTSKNAGTHTVGVSWGYRPAALLSLLGAELILENGEEITDIPLKIK